MVHTKGLGFRQESGIAVGVQKNLEFMIGTLRVCLRHFDLKLTIILLTLSLQLHKKTRNHKIRFITYSLMFVSRILKHGRMSKKHTEGHTLTSSYVTIATFDPRQLSDDETSGHGSH